MTVLIRRRLTAAMDALSDVLRVVRLTGGVFLDARFTAPWSVAGKVEPEEIRAFIERPEHVIGFIMSWPAGCRSASAMARRWK